MGTPQSLERPSDTCIPFPNKKTKEELERRGVKFDQDRKGKMINCTLPLGWKIVMIRDTHDLVSAFLRDENDQNVATIVWISNEIFGKKAHITLSKDSNT